MIKYNNSSINDWNYGDDNIIKVYRHNAVCYYKVIQSGGTTAQTPCFAVVNDISQYQETEFEDVFNKSDDSWYKLNNLNQYEKYGLYGSGLTITTYEGKLTVDDGYEYQYSGGSWVYVGEVSGGTIIKSPEYLERTSTANGYVPLGEYFTENTVIEIDFQMTQSKGTAIIGDFGSNDSDDWRVFLNYDTQVNNWLVYDFNSSRFTYNTGDWSKRFHLEIGNYYIKDLDSGNYLINATKKTSFTRPNQMFLFHIEGSQGINNIDYGHIYSLKIYQNNVLVKDFIPWTDMNGNYGLFDKVSMSAHTSTQQMTGSSTINDVKIGGTASLPNVPFTVNYNAKNYDSTTKTLAKTSGQLADVDAVITAGTPTVNDNYLTIARYTRAPISGYQQYFNRDASNPNLTIISKQLTNGGNCHLFANRGGSYNWMYRPTSTKLNFHGSSQIGGTDTTTQPVIESIRVDSNRLLTFNNYTDNTSSTYNNFNYGGLNLDGTALFAGYYSSSNNEWFDGDFYWIYMSQTTLTDDQVQQVIAYNEGGGQTIYPLKYTVKSDPPDNLTFNTMAEALAYECPWVGMTATIDGTEYMFCEGNEWLTKYSYVEVTGDYICENGNKYKKMQEYGRQSDGTLTPTSNYVKGDLIEADAPDCTISCIYNFCGVDTNGNTVTIDNGTNFLGQSDFTSPYPVEGIVGAATTRIGAYAFQNVKDTLSALAIANTVTRIEHESFMETALLTTLTIPSSVTQIDFWAFTRCDGLQEVIFEGTTPPTFTDENSGVFHDYCPPRIYVPDSAVEAYRAISGEVWTNQSWSSDIIQPISNRIS